VIVAKPKCRRTIYRVLESEIKARELKQKKRKIGWQGEQLKIVTGEGIELTIEYSNQVWQCDHTPADILVVDQEGEVLGRPCLTTVIDTYSRCIVVVERPFGKLNSEFFSTLPGYTTCLLKGNRSRVEAEACVRFEDLERLLVRQDRRVVYDGGFIRFANLVYRGEYLAGYAGQSVVLRYDPRDISSLLVYRQQGSKDVFLTRAHAQHLDTERLSLAEAKAIKRRLRQQSKAITNQSVLKEVSQRSRYVESLSQESAPSFWERSSEGEPLPESIKAEIEPEEPVAPRKLPEVKVYDYEQLRRENGR
jgi:Mu transposase, C-terminal